ncbi:MAG: alkyl sulfatase dimerization domain-containing protein [Promethearchaeota archaeon]
MVGLFVGLGETTTFADGICHLIGAFGNSCVVETAEGLIIFDIGVKQYGSEIFREIRNITDKPVKYIIYSHGHFDHCFGYAPFIEEIQKKGWEFPQIIAHENCLNRFQKYRILDKYHDWLNRQQFASIVEYIDYSVSAHETLDPTIVIRGNEKYVFELDGLIFELYHEWGETDDALWLWFPEKEVIFAGDLIISGFPNVGNPYKVQRYPKHWALAMERMIEKKAEFLAPGHGRLIVGKETVKDVLSITAEAMHFVHDEVVKRMNQGKWFEEIYHEILEIYPDRLKNSEHLKPAYGCLQYAIHAVYRLYHGWYNSGNPTDLAPAKSIDIAKEFLKINSPEKYIEHGKRLFEKGKLQLALHIIDPVIKGIDPSNNDILLEALKLKLMILEQKVMVEPSFISSNILKNGTHQIRNKIKELKSL